MDTDWCIVCDTRISPHTGCLSEISNEDTTNNNVTIEAEENGAIQPSSWAFCSTNCFIKAYEEAQSKKMSEIRHSSSPKIHAKISKRGTTFTLKPLRNLGHKDPQSHPHKIFFDSDSSSTSSSSSNSRSKSNQQNFISPFTFGSYGSSAMSCSNLCEFPAPRC